MNTAQVYYCYAGADLIYIGVSTMLKSRLQQHGYKSPWWSSVTAVEVTRLMECSAAQRLEMAEIAAHEPRHNYVGTAAWRADMTRRSHSRRQVPAMAVP